MSQTHQSNAISSWPESERPRERIFRCGVEALSDAELVAVLLRTGVRGRDAVAFSRELLARFKGLRGLLGAEKAELAGTKGLGHAKVAAILAVNEMTRRRLREEVVGKSFIRDAGAVVEYLQAVLKDRKKEFFKVLFLDKGNRVTDDRDLFRGTVDEAAVYTREIVKTSLDCHATALVLVHNHPSGRVQPSREDLEITRKIRQACETVSIRVLDHIIVGDGQYFSFSEHRLLG